MDPSRSEAESPPLEHRLAGQDARALWSAVADRLNAIHKSVERAVEVYQEAPRTTTVRSDAGIEYAITGRWSFSRGVCVEVRRTGPSRLIGTTTRGGAEYAGGWTRERQRRGAEFVRDFSDGVLIEQAAADLMEQRTRKEEREDAGREAAVAQVLDAGRPLERDGMRAFRDAVASSIWIVHHNVSGELDEYPSPERTTVVRGESGAEYAVSIWWSGPPSLWGQTVCGVSRRGGGFIASTAGAQVKYGNLSTEVGRRMAAEFARDFSGTGLAQQAASAFRGQRESARRQERDAGSAAVTRALGEGR